MYEATFQKDDIVLKKRKLITLVVDYQSGQYKGQYCIDVVKKENFSNFLDEVTADLIIFAKRLDEHSKDYYPLLAKEFGRLQRLYHGK